MSNFCENLKTGDSVVICFWSWCGRSYRKTTVQRITPKGFINVDGVLYRSDGYARSGGSCLMDAADPDVVEKLEKYEETLVIQSAIKKMHSCNSISYAKANKILEILEE